MSAPTEQNGRPDQGRPLLSVDVQGMAYGRDIVLGQISFDLKRGDTLALTGPSGVGKSTLIRAIAGLDTRYRGTIARPDKVAMVFQEPTLLPWRNAVENITLTCGVSAARARSVLADVGLKGREDLFPDQLSLGQQRRLSLARAFASDPDLMLLDEPFVSLDPDLVDEMMRLFAGLRAARKLTTVLVTHSEREAELLASRIIKLDGKPAQIARDDQNKGAYFQLSASGVTSSRS
ncbi:ABC transporter ATP-binding protein [Rhodovulum sp. FJ3]|uniref:ABC transporter ATP-binding protein n=1 Tax=Rhodovulum sp. FJ3 TaxID=3079053 RepID=UPI00293DFE9D|nr:ABC transporter ATP-binding protein [Rhodovulum sp. FJ3]MDV4167263.1 ABC transporter ATP-binding protein [Rhodovulum sp. FJ3]